MSRKVGTLRKNIFNNLSRHNRQVEERQQTAASPPKGGTETVLVAENNEEVRGLIKHVLEKAGYRVIEASDGEEAVHKFRENRDSFLLDVTMPRKNGREAYKEIKGINPLIRAVFRADMPRR